MEDKLLVARDWRWSGEKGQDGDGCSYKRTTQEILLFGTVQNIDYNSRHTNLHRWYDCMKQQEHTYMSTSKTREI